MTKQEILEREDAQSTTIHLYKEGIFWKAYEYSAYRFVFGILKCKPKKQRFKETSTEMIHIGFPLTSLDTHQDSFRLISKDENTCTIEPVDFLPQMTFEELKNSIETTVSNNKGANLMLPKGTSPTDEYIINKVRSFNIESKTPMDCMMFLGRVIERHAELLTEFYDGDERMAVHDLRKHVAWYLKGFPVGGSTRRAFMECENLEDVRREIGRLDPNIRFPERIADKPRGRVRFAKKVHLPYGWLESRETTHEEREALFGDDPMDASY